MAGALSLGASDIHIEPEADTVRMRYRVDGVLADVLTMDGATYKLILSRIKLLSGLKLNLTSVAQDGRLSIVVKEKEIEIRTSILPGNYGESVVMRVLDPSSIGLSLEVLGFDKYLVEIFKHEISKPNGMILNTGPTGSGKTTTLYAFLKAVHNPGIKIITIEDPIEYHLGGIVQTQVDKQYTFALGLRSVLRQDPDVIMVGEIRDSEVASTAVQAALTGHLVFSTLHTNNAAGTFPRLIDMGVNAEILGSAVSVAMAQRLVRRLCEHCRKQQPLEGEDKALVERWLENIPHPESIPEDHSKSWVPVGCDKCNNTGYSGRIAVVEVILMDEEIEEIIRTNPSEREIMHAARNQNIRIMQEDGIVKVLQGVTALEELSRVVDLSEHAMLSERASAKKDVV
jgi:type IV pilus assembly protein PilB